MEAVGIVMPIVCEALGLPPSRCLVLENLVRGDLETYMSTAIEDSAAPKIAAMRHLGDAGHIGHTALYKMLDDGLVADMERCALAVPLLLEMRGDFVNRTVWCAVELKSQVGKEAQGPGIVAGRQLLFGLALAGGDMCLPACLQAPDEEIDETHVTHQIAGMVERVADVADQLRRYACTRDNGLAAFNVDANALAERPGMSTLLVPQLHLRTSTHGEWSLPVRPNAAALWEAMRPHSVRRLVVESTANPNTEPEAWDRISPEVLGQLLSLASQTGLDTAVRPSEVTYLLRADGHALHRHQHGDISPSRALAGIAQGMSFEIEGFENHGERRNWAEAIAYIEFLATSECVMRCTRRFGESHSPAAIKAPNARGLLCAVRMIENDLMVSAARQRQAAEQRV